MTVEGNLKMNGHGNKWSLSQSWPVEVRPANGQVLATFPGRTSTGQTPSEDFLNTKRTSPYWRVLNVLALISYIEGRGGGGGRRRRRVV